MELTITLDVSSPRRIALERAMDAYNERNAPLNETAFLQKMVDAHLDSLVASYLTTTISKLNFLDRFTPQERIIIRAAAAQNPTVNDYLELLNAAQVVDLTSARTIAGVSALEAATLIAAGRASEILAL
jgi:hypothetical protein